MILQWLRVEFGEGTVYENPPPAEAAQHWGQIYHALPEALPTKAGERHAINAFWHTDALTLWAQ